VGSGALVSLLSSTRQTVAQKTSIRTVPTDPFIILTRGVYVPVSDGPNLGLEGVNFLDGSYARSQTYAVFGLPDADNEDESEINNVAHKPIGHAYVRPSAPMDQAVMVFDLAGGAMLVNNLMGQYTPHPDGVGGTYLQASFECTVADATGIFQDFKGGHDHMVDRLHLTASGKLDEFCFCVISQYPFP
jgi:hypothetical protein